MKHILTVFNCILEKKSMQLPYMGADNFLLSFNTKDIVKDLENLKDLFDFSKFDKNHKLFSKKNEKVIGQFKSETLKNLCVNACFVCEVKHICSNVLIKTQINLKVFQILKLGKVNLMSNIIAYLEVIAKKIVIVL